MLVAFQIFLLWLAGIIGAMQFAKIGAILPELATLYPESSRSLGWMLSLISLTGVALGLLASMLAMKVGERSLLIAALLLAALVSLGQSTLPTMPLMLISRFVEGFSHLGIVVATPVLISRIAPLSMRGYAMMLWGTFFGVGFTLMSWIGVPLVDHIGVSGIFALHGCLAFVMALALILLLPTPKTAADDQPKILQSNTVLGVRSILQLHVLIYRSPTIAAPAWGWFFYTLTFVSLLSVIPGLLTAENRVFTSSLMPVAGIVISLTLGMYLLSITTAVRVVLLGFALAAIVVSMIVVGVRAPVVFIILFGVLGLIQGASYAAIPQLNRSSHDQALANGAIAQMGNLGNLLGTPLLLLGLSGFGFAGAFLSVIVCYCSAIAVHLVMARRRMASDE